MKDRIPTKILSNGAIRYGVYDDAGNLLRYEYIKPEDEPTQVGDALNKANLLPDGVAAALGLTGNPQVKDALMALALGEFNYVYIITLQRPDGSKIANAPLTGILDRFGNPAVTDVNGIAVGFSSSGSVTVTFTSPFFDLQDATATIVATGTVTEYTLTSALTASQVTITSSRNIKFSLPALIDIHLIGAGFDGSAGVGNSRGGNGGASGYQKYILGIEIDTGEYPAFIGATNGAATTFKGYTSAGGVNEPGGLGANTYIWPPDTNEGKASTTKLFGTGAVVGGGSGGGGGWYAMTPIAGFAGGNPYGGKGGDATGNYANAVQAGQAGRGYGGGGGGGGTGGAETKPGGAGYQGAMFIRWEYAS